MRVEWQMRLPPQTKVSHDFTKKVFAAFGSQILRHGVSVDRE